MTTIKKPKYELYFKVNIETSGPSDAEVIERCTIEITTKPVEPWWWAFTEPSTEFLYYQDSTHLFRPEIQRIAEAMEKLAQAARDAMTMAGYEETRQSQRSNGPDLGSTSSLKKYGT